MQQLPGAAVMRASPCRRAGLGFWARQQAARRPALPPRPTVRSPQWAHLHAAIRFQPHQGVKSGGVVVLGVHARQVDPQLVLQGIIAILGQARAAA